MWVIVRKILPYKRRIRHRTPVTPVRDRWIHPRDMSRQGISAAHTRAYMRVCICNASQCNATVNLVRKRCSHAAAKCVTLCRAARPYTFHGNPDRIRRTVGERNVSRILPSRLADPVPPWRQPGCSLSLPSHLPSSMSSYPPAHLLTLDLFIYSLFFSPFCRFPLNYSTEITYGKIRVHRGGSDNE